MDTYNIENIAKIVKGKLLMGGNNNSIKYLINDSRSIISPEQSLFFAIIGERRDGHDFILDLYTKGVKNFIVSKTIKELEKFSDCNFIIVENTINALHYLTIFHRNRFNIPIIGITGSNGKTIIKEWLFQILNKDFNIVRSPKSYNSQIGVPLSVWLLENNTTLGIFEAGISKVSEMNNLQKIINPEIGIFTNISEAHQENFINHKHKIKEKLKLFTNCKKIIYCKDYQLIDSQIHKNGFFENSELFTWSKKYPADLYINQEIKKNGTTDIFATYKNTKINIEIPFIDDASIENSIHVWSLMLYLEYDNDEIKKRILNLSPIAMRLELKEGLNNCIIINDSYNSDIGSLSIAIDFLNQQKQYKKKTLILSDILQSGVDEKMLYKEIATLAAEKKIDKIIGIGEQISKQAKSFNIDKEFFFSTDAFFKSITDGKLKNEAILLKGARKFGFEKISKALQQKTHDTVLEINLNAIISNLNYYRSLLLPKTKIMCMVKAFSYGSGIYEIANLLQHQKIDYLTVAYIDEGVQLRSAGITLPIMVMNPEKASFDVMIDNHLEPEIYNFSGLDSFIQAITKQGVANYPIHIKIDTGMKRLGFEDSEIPLLIQQLKGNNSLEIKSIFSHLVASDESIHDEFTHQQVEIFKNLSSSIIKRFPYPILRHILNTSGIERFKDYQFNMVRLGIGMYGISSVKPEKLETVSTLKSIISQIKSVDKGTTIGYGRSGVVSKKSLIATIPIGYADGLNRKLGNGVGAVIINGKKTSIIGNICMDMCMVDISTIDAKEGDEVLIFGKEYPVTKLAEQIGTIPYEIFTSISQRVKRVYFQE